METEQADSGILTGAHTRLRAVLYLLVLLAPSPAAADWLITPFVGSAFGGETNYIDLEQGAGKTKLTLGGSVALLGSGILGLEADFGYAPHFFERDTRAVLVTHSNVTTLSGNLIAAVPVAVTRESLRPYVSAGVGAMHVKIEDVLAVFPVSSTLTALNMGGGAIGLLTPRTGLRFDVRQFRSITGDQVTGRLDTARLRFWRATVGVTFRY